MNKQVKNRQGFDEKNKQFQLDSGWVLFSRKLDFGKAMELFKFSEVDPRELALLID